MILAEATTHRTLAPQRPVDPGRQSQVESALPSALPSHCDFWAVDFYHPAGTTPLSALKT